MLAQRTQAPSGLGYLLENRLIISRLFPEAFRDLKVQRLAASYRALLESLAGLCPAPPGVEPRIVLLTPGPYNETYFEHAYLARYLGVSLVEGSDLTVRDERLYLKTLHGLEPVHGVLKRLDDAFLDPLELRPDSHLGVPGLLEAIRAGNVLVANCPGSGLLESPALLGFLPALARHLLGEELRLPSLPTGWCGERAALLAALPQLARGVVKDTCGGAGSGAIVGPHLSRGQLDECARRILREPDRHTVQGYLRLSQMPTWRNAPSGDPILPRSLLLRVFALSDGAGSWRVLPGGLTRLAGGGTEGVDMQRGGSSADTWVLTEGEVDATTLPHHEHPEAGRPRRSRTVTSRAAENLFWLGRYTERTENTARLARLALQSLTGEDQNSQPLLAWLGELAVGNGLVHATVPAPAQARRVFERSLLAALGDRQDARSVGYNLHALRRAASAVRERLSQEQWNLIERAEEEFQRGCDGCASEADASRVEALRRLETLSGHTAAMTGAQTDAMTRRRRLALLSTGRQPGTPGVPGAGLAGGFDNRTLFDRIAGFDAVLALFDSTITFRAHYQQRHDLPALLEPAGARPREPRSLGWVAQALRGPPRRLAGAPAGVPPAMVLALPTPEDWTLEDLCQRDVQGRPAALLALLQRCVDASWRLCDDLTARYFAHSADARHTVGA